MNRQNLKVPIKRILFLVEDSVKNDYDTDKLCRFLAKTLGNKLSDSEIEEYCSWYLTEQAESLDFTKESFETAKEILEEFRELYLSKKD